MLKGCSTEKHIFLLSSTIISLFSYKEDHKKGETGKSGPFLFTAQQLWEAWDNPSPLSCPMGLFLMHPGIQQECRDSPWQQRTAPAKHIGQLIGKVFFKKDFMTPWKVIALSMCRVYELLLEVYLPEERSRTVVRWKKNDPSMITSSWISSF